MLDLEIHKIQEDLDFSVFLIILLIYTSLFSLEKLN